MIGPIVWTTVRGLLGRRRSLLMLLLALLPVLAALLARINGRAPDMDRITPAVIDLLIVQAALPIITLVFGTAALGSELEDGTAIYLLIKPIDRWRIVVAKTVVAAGVSALLLGATTFLAAFLLAGDQGLMRLVVGLTVAVMIGAVVYVSIFVALSVVTNRALIIGLVYAVLWEGLLSGLFDGTRELSVRQYVLGIARTLAGDQGGSIRAAPELVGSIGFLLAIVAIVVAVVLGSNRLAAFQIRGAD